MKHRIKDSVEGRFTKKILLTCILIVGIIFIAGCISEEKTDAGTPASSQISQESGDQASDLILKPSDVPGLTLEDYSLIAVSKSSIHTFKNESYNKEYAYKDVLPLGTRNVGQYSTWVDESGRAIFVRLDKYDSDVPIKDFKVDFTYTTEGIQKSKEMGIDMGDPHIGDCSFYWTTTDLNTDIQTTGVVFVYSTNHVGVQVTDEEGKSKKEAIRIAKIIKTRLD